MVCECASVAGSFYEHTERIAWPWIVKYLCQLLSIEVGSTIRSYTSNWDYQYKWKD